MRLSVIVCTHSDERRARLLACVASLRSGRRRADQLLVVVDSNPELVAKLAIDLAPEVDLLESDGRGISAARNTGIKQATGDVVAFLDDDAVAAPDWLAQLECAFASRPDAIGAGGRIVPDWEVAAHSLPDELLWVVGSTYRGHPEEVGPILRPIGCNMAFRRDAVVKVGGFSQDFGPSGNANRTHRNFKPHSNEEIVLALALRDRFGPDRIVYWPSAVVSHFAPADRVSWRYLVTRCRAEGKSKADVRRLYGRDSMSYDGSYLGQVLLPAIVRYLGRGIRHAERADIERGCMGVAAAAITGAAYLRRLYGPAAVGAHR